MYLEVEATDACLCLEPVIQLFGCMGSPIVQNEDHILDAALECFRNDHLLHKGLEIDKTLALTADSVDFATSNGNSGKQVACSATVITFLVSWKLPTLFWARRLLAFAGLNRGFFIQADEPGTALQESLCLKHMLRAWDGHVARIRLDG